MANKTLLLLVLALWGCWGSDSASIDEEEEPVEPHVLEGSWTTTGVDERYGEATVQMKLESMGDLVVSVELTVGGTLRFAGMWSVEGQTLLLSGAYFEPDGHAQATWSVEGDSVMVLEVLDGNSQRWRREN